MPTYDFYNKLYVAIKIAEEEYPEDGYCYQRARIIRNKMGTGSIATFSMNGISADSHSFELYKQPAIRIPFDKKLYRGGIDWVYHSVYLYDNLVFTYEIGHLIPLSQYRKMLDSSTMQLYNNQMILNKNSKHYVKMIYENVKAL